MSWGLNPMIQFILALASVLAFVGFIEWLKWLRSLMWPTSTFS